MLPSLDVLLSGLKDTCSVPVVKPTPAQLEVQAPNPPAKTQPPLVVADPIVQHTVPAPAPPPPPALPSSLPTYEQSPYSATSPTQGYLQSTTYGHSQTPLTQTSPQEQSPQSPSYATTSFSQSTTKPHKGGHMSVGGFAFCTADLLIRVDRVDKGARTCCCSGCGRSSW